MVATAHHCIYCFDVLANHLSNSSSVSAPTFEDASYPLFVTWNTNKKGRKELRGCIGNFTPLGLHVGLKEYALTSALNDHRFPPISKQELSQLSCSVSLLTNFEPAKSHLDWEIGTHGIWIEFRDRGGRKRTATYLPDVMPEQGWTKIQAIDSLLRKGGFTEAITQDVRDSILLTRYQSSKHVVTHEEYLAHLASQKRTLGHL